MQMSHNWHLSILFHFWKAFWYIHMLGQKSSSNKFHRAKIIQFSSVAQSCLTLCDLMNHSTSGLPVHHQLQESTQTHIHWVSDAIQPSHPLSSPFSSFLQSFTASGSFPDQRAQVQSLVGELNPTSCGVSKKKDCGNPAPSKSASTIFSPQQHLLISCVWVTFW